MSEYWLIIWTFPAAVMGWIVVLAFISERFGLIDKYEDRLKRQQERDDV